MSLIIATVDEQHETFHLQGPLDFREPFVLFTMHDAESLMAGPLPDDVGRRRKCLLLEADRT